MITYTNTFTISENSILAALPEDEYDRILPHLEEVELRLGEIIYRPDEPIQHVYFPQRSTLSVIVIMEDGSEVEVGVIGNEGMSGMPVILGTDSAPLQMIVQGAGRASRIRVGLFRDALKRCEQLHMLLLRYGQAFFIQTAQTAACNRYHRLDRRMARWLLMCHDRKKSSELELTHEFLSVMLGVRRAGVSEAASKLKSEGLIDYTRGHVRIVDREGLEAASCECYGVVKKEFARLLPYHAIDASAPVHY